MEDIVLFLGNRGLDISRVQMAITDTNHSDHMLERLQNSVNSLVHNWTRSEIVSIGTSLEEAEQRIPQILESFALDHYTNGLLERYNSQVNEHLSGMGIDVKTCQFRQITVEERLTRQRILHTVKSQIKDHPRDEVVDGVDMKRLIRRYNRYYVGKLVLVQMSETLIPAKLLNLHK